MVPFPVPCIYFIDKEEQGRFQIPSLPTPLGRHWRARNVPAHLPHPCSATSSACLLILFWSLWLFKHQVQKWQQHGAPAESNYRPGWGFHAVASSKRHPFSRFPVLSLHCLFARSQPSEFSGLVASVLPLVPTQWGFRLKFSNRSDSTNTFNENRCWSTSEF